MRAAADEKLRPKPETGQEAGAGKRQAPLTLPSSSFDFTKIASIRSLCANTFFDWIFRWRRRSMSPLPSDCERSRAMSPCCCEFTSTCWRKSSHIWNKPFGQLRRSLRSSPFRFLNVSTSIWSSWPKRSCKVARACEKSATLLSWIQFCACVRACERADGRAGERACACVRCVRALRCVCAPAVLDLYIYMFFFVIFWFNLLS